MTRLRLNADGSEWEEARSAPVGGKVGEAPGVARPLAADLGERIIALEAAPKVETPPPRVPGARMPNFRDDIARKKIGDPKWEPCIWEAIGRAPNPEGVLISGGEPQTITRGKRKGQFSWSHIKRYDLTRTVVLTAEEDAAKAEYERATGNCCRCGGGGEQWAGWHHITGTMWTTCRRCDGTGNARALAENVQPPATRSEATPNHGDTP